MYLPKQYHETRVDVLHDTMCRIGAATVVAQGPDGMIASHVPIEVDGTEGENGTLRCHFSKANPHVAAIAAGGEVLVIFQGPQGYATPNWYPSKHQTGKAVPTWLYVTIHAYGQGATYDDIEKLKRHLAAMTDHFEAPYELPWKMADAPDDYIASKCKGIVGIEIPISRLEGKWKMNQAKSEHDVLGVINGLRAQGDGNLADLVASANEQKQQG